MPEHKSSRPASQCRPATNSLKRDNGKVVALHRPDMRKVSAGVELVLSVWDDQPGKFFCVATQIEGGDERTWRDKFFARDEFDQVETYVKRNLDDRHIYFCAHGLLSKSRKEVAPTKYLWADLDGVDPKTIKKFRPTIEIESSPGRYVGLWELNKPTTDIQLNHRLTDHCGADNGGWGWTKVLRFPGTINHKAKYKNRPQAKVLRDDGSAYAVAELEKGLPKVAAKSSALVDRTPSTSSAETLWNKHGRKFKHTFRRRFTSPPTKGADRSEGIYSFGQTLIEKGVPPSDAFVMMKASPWNKFDQRSDEEERLWEIIDDAEPPKKTRSTAKDGDLSIDESEFEAQLKELDYLVDGLFLRGSLYSFTAHTGAGKTAIALLLTMCVGIGRDFAERETEKGRVLYFAGENPHDIRMRWGGMKNKYGFDKADVRFIDGTLDIEEMYDRIEKEMEKYGDRSLVIVDTGPAYLNGREENSNNEMIAYAQMLRRLTGLPGNPTVIVLCHPAKGSLDPLVPRGGYGFYTEVDGNFYAIGNRPMAEVKCDPQKFRGVPFEDIDFEMVGGPSRVKNKKGQWMPTVTAKFLTLEERTTSGLRTLAEQEKLLLAMHDKAGASMAELAAACDWNKSKVQRVMNDLSTRDLVKKPKNNSQGAWALSSTGKKRADELASRRSAADEDDQ